MKKLIYLLSIFSVMMLFTSCFEKLDNWYSETASYDGRFVVAKTCEEYEDDNTAIEDGEEVMIYNSAANVANEIIIDTHIVGFPIKGKFKVDGNSLAFKAEQPVANISRSAEFAHFDDDMYLVNAQGTPIAYPSDLGNPEGVGEEYDAVQIYSQLSLGKGNITPQGAKTIGGNTSDGVHLEITLYSEFLIIESYELPKEKWIDPAVPEYSWRVKEGSRHNADGWEEHWTLAGYRYTGLPEDLGINPPIIKK
jgi:hypothetical protein